MVAANVAGQSNSMPTSQMGHANGMAQGAVQNPQWYNHPNRNIHSSYSPQKGRKGKLNLKDSNLTVRIVTLYV